jgi:hypothetical protein
MKEGKGRFVDFDKPVDPAVDAIFGEVEERRNEIQLTPEERAKLRLQRARERKRKAAEKVRIRDRRVNRVTYDFPPELRSQVAEIAEARSIPASQLAAWLLTRAFEHFGGEEDLTEALRPYLSPSRSPRYTWNLCRFVEGGNEK